MEEEVKSFSMDVKSLEEEVTDLFGVINDKETAYAFKIEELKKELESVRSEFDRKISAYENEKRKLLEKIEEIRNEDEKNLAKQRESYERIVSELSIREKKLLEKVDRFNLEIYSRKSEIEKSNAEIRKLNSLNAMLEEKLSEAKSLILKKEEMAKNASLVASDREVEIKKLWQVIEGQKKEILEKGVEIRRKEEEVRKMAMSARSLEIETGKLKSSLEKTEQGFFYKLEILKKEILEKNRRINEMERLLTRKNIESAKTSESVEEKTQIEREEKKGENFEIHELKEQSARLARENASLKKRCEMLVREKHVAESEFNEKFLAKEQEIVALNSLVSSLRKELSELTERWKFDSAQLQNAASNLRTANSEIEILKTKIVSLEAESENYKKLLSESSESLAKISDLGKKSEDDKVRSVDQILERENKKYSLLLKKFEETNSKLRESEQEKAELEIRIKNLENSLHKSEEKLSVFLREKDREIEKLSEELSAREVAFEKKLAEAANKERKKHVKLIQEMHALSKVLAHKETSLDETNIQIENLRSEYEALRAREKELTEKYSKEIAEENRLLKEASFQIARKEREEKNLLSMIESLKKEIMEVRSEAIDRLKKAGSRKGKHEDKLRRDLNKREGEINALKEKLAKLAEEKRHLIEKEIRLKSEFSRSPYKEKLKESRRELVKKENRIRELTLQLESIKEEMDKIRSESGLHYYFSAYSADDFQELVAGISHQISNSISIMRSHAEYALEAYDKRNIKDSLEAIVRSIIGLQKKIEYISNFAQGFVPQKKEVNLKNLVEDTVNILKKRSSFENIDIQVVSDKNLKNIWVDSIRLEEALEYIFYNASEAMGLKGRIKVEIRNAADALNIIVSDYGCGIETRHLETVFQPFFTTKHSKIGLGLSIAKNIIKAHGGQISLESRLNEGTRVMISLPRS